MRRPLKDRDFGEKDRFPILDRPRVFARSGSSNPDEELEEVKDDEVHFDSMEDLPDSPMLKEYVQKLSNYFDKPPEKIINTQPVRDYMKRLGVWKQAKEQNT